MPHLTEPQRITEILREADVVVLGGGPAGIAAAWAAGGIDVGALHARLERDGAWLRRARTKLYLF